MARKSLRVNHLNWLLPVLYALPIVGLCGAALLIWGDELRDLISILIKVAVIA